jgi:hypothetical protein
MSMPAQKNTKAKAAHAAASGDLSKDDYAVGYGRPPVATRFQPGQSGNPKGRPAGRPNLKTMVERVIHRKVQVREGQQARELPMLEAILQTHAVKAVKGDVRSATLILNLAKPGLAPEPGESEQVPGDNRPPGTASLRPSMQLFTNVDLAVLSEEEKIELSRLADIIDLGGDITALSVADFARARDIINKGRGKDITPQS